MRSYVCLGWVAITVAACSVANAPEDPTPPPATQAGTGGSSSNSGSASGGEQTGGSGGCEGPLTTLADCGACGVKCEPSNAKDATCAKGTCEYGSCEGAFADCDDDKSNGCEVDSATDIKHCGACGATCSPRQIINVGDVTCTEGACDYDACSTGFGDCDGEKSNGCEQSLDNLEHCLACDSKCDAPNATSKCGANGCEVDACNKGTANCDMMYATGCEVTLADDVNHCGKCNTVCAGNQAKCVAGTCTKVADCTLVTTMSMWGTSAKGMDFRSWTDSELHWMGCAANIGCEPNNFFCTYDANAETLTFGSNVQNTVRAVVDPGNAAGDTMPTQLLTCCSANEPTQVCNAPDGNDNGSNISSIKALCSALGYKNGLVLKSQPNNSCPEPNAVNTTGKKWTSDFVNSEGYGYEFRCIGFK